MPNSPQPKVFGYNAEATDFETGMQYLRARYYDTGLQRFVQEDDYRGSYTNPISMNRYAYVHNNPVMGVDPSGYRPIEHGPEVVKPKFSDDYYAKMRQIEALTDGGTGGNLSLSTQEVDGNSVPSPINQYNDESAYCSYYEDEKIVISSFEWPEDSDKIRYRYNFIEPAIKKIAEYDEMGALNVTWLIESSYTDEQKANFEMDAGRYDVEIVYYDGNEQFINYMNTGDANVAEGEREMQISDIDWFGHGMPEYFYIAGEKVDGAWTHTNLYVEDILALNESSFNETSTTLYTCRSANLEENSPAAAWSDVTNGTVEAMVGRVDYAEITLNITPTNLIPERYIAERIVDWLKNNELEKQREEEGRGYLKDGSIYYPSEGHEAYWVTYEDGKLLE